MPYSISDSYFNAQFDAAERVTLAVLETVLGYHCFSAGPYAAINLPVTTPYQIGGGRLLSVSDLSETLIPDATDIFAAYTQTETPDCTITLFDQDDFFSLFLQSYSFLGASLTITTGYLSTPYADMLTLFSGTVQRETLTPETLTILGVAE